jgi:hypothetical protein
MLSQHFGVLSSHNPTISSGIGRVVRSCCDEASCGVLSSLVAGVSQGLRYAEGRISRDCPAEAQCRLDRAVGLQYRCRRADRLGGIVGTCASLLLCRRPHTPRLALGGRLRCHSFADYKHILCAGKGSRPWSGQGINAEHRRAHIGAAARPQVLTSRPGGGLTVATRLGGKPGVRRRRPGTARD